MDREKNPRVSICIPLFNEEAVLPELLRRVRAVVDALPGGPHEILLVNDGSTDATPQMLRDEAAKDDRLTVLLFSRNFGHQAAISAALDHASGDVVVLMDGDLQDRPEEIPRFIEQWREGYDVVYAVRAKRKEGPLKRFAYWLFYRIVRFLSSVRLPVDSGDFSLLSRPVVDAISGCGEVHRYIRGLRAWAGFRQIGVTVERDARTQGEAKYSFIGLIRLAFDGIFSFSVVPLRFATFLGSLMLLVSFVYGAYALWVKLFGDGSPQGFTALALLLIMTSGVQLMFLGVVGEYVGRIYNEAKGRPTYLVGDILNRKR